MRRSLARRLKKHLSGAGILLGGVWLWYGWSCFRGGVNRPPGGRRWEVTPLDAAGFFKLFLALLALSVFVLALSALLAWYSDRRRGGLLPARIVRVAEIREGDRNFVEIEFTFRTERGEHLVTQRVRASAWAVYRAEHPSNDEALTRNTQSGWQIEDL